VEVKEIQVSVVPVVQVLLILLPTCQSLGPGAGEVKAVQQVALVEQVAGVLVQSETQQVLLVAQTLVAVVVVAVIPMETVAMVDQAS